jgi:hypothetical protein
LGENWDRFKRGLERFAREVGHELKHKFQQGCDELANCLFTGRAYMPWPGPRQQTLHQQAEHAIDLQDEIASIREARVVEPESTESDKHRNLYVCELANLPNLPRDDNRGISR